MSMRRPWSKAILSYFMGFISIPLGFLVIGIIPAVFCCTISYSLFRDSQTRALAYPGYILGGLGIVHCLLILSFTLYSGFLYGSEDPLQVRWKSVHLGSFTIKTPEGDLINSEQFIDQKLVVAYWASWCAPCISEIPYLNSLNKNSEITVIGISSEGMATIANAREQYSIEYTIGKLEKPAEAFLEVTRLPTIFFIDRNGIIQDVKVGLQDYFDLKKLALKSDYKGEIRRFPRELFNGVDLILSFWAKFFDRLGATI